MTNVVQPDVTITSLVFIIAISIGFFLSLTIFLSPKGNTRANKFLSMLIFLFSVVQIWDILRQSRLILLVPNMLMVVNPLILLLGPFVYFYVISLTNIHWKFGVKHLIHFIPAIAFYIYFLPVYLLTEQDKLQLIVDAIQNHKFIIPQPFYITAGVQIFIYIGYSIMLIYQHSKHIKNSFSFIERLNLNWLKRLLFIFIFLWLAFVLRSLYQISLIWEVSALLSVLTMYIIGYFGYNQPVIFQDSTTTLPEGNKETKKKYASSSLTDEEITEYLKKIQALMNNEKIFLKNDLKIGDLAEKIDLPVNYVSQVINEKLGKSFYDFVNEYRVDEAQKRFADTKNDNFTILAIGYDSGFNSKTAFYSAFKKRTGVIPSEFKRRLIAQ